MTTTHPRENVAGSAPEHQGGPTGPAPMAAGGPSGHTANAGASRPPGQETRTRVAQPRFLAPVSSSRAGCGRLPTPALPNSGSQAKPAVYARERRGSLPLPGLLPGLESSRFGCWLRGPYGEYRAIIESGGSRGLLQCRRRPVGGAAQSSLRASVAATSADAPPGSAVDSQRGDRHELGPRDLSRGGATGGRGRRPERSPQAPTDRIEQHAGPREH